MTSKVFATLMAIVLCVGFIPYVPAIAYADNGLVRGEPLFSVQESGGAVTGGGAIDAGGTYTLADDATGTITISEGLEVTLVGKGASTKFKDLNIKVGNDTVLTIQDVYADQGSTASTIDFLGNGTLKIEGTNLIDNDGGLNAAVIHVGAGNEVHFDGAGTLYGYKSALCSYIGGNAGEANGTIVFNGGYWFLKGTKTGAVIGGDSTTDKGGDIVINGGELYVKGVAKGALIGGSNQGLSGDVYVNGGLVELFEDFSGPAIGAGNADNAGAITVTGGSIKPTLGSNSYNSYGGAASYNGLATPSWNAVKATNASDYALLAFDASNYITNLATDSVEVYVDGATTPFYKGRAYTYVTNEVKNPSGPTGTTMDNWLTNDAANLVTEADYNGTAYPAKNGSSLVPEKNLYFALSKADHVLKVGSDVYSVAWDEETAAFACEKLTGYKWYTEPAVEKSYTISSADELAEFATIVNGTVPAAYGIAQDDFADATVALAADIDLSAIADWTPIGGADKAFAGTFDGAGHAITGLAITSNGGYKGLFGNNAGTVKDFTISGSLGTETAPIGGSSKDFWAAAVAFNTGTVSGVVNKATLYMGVGDTYAVGGIVGKNQGGTVSQCGNEGAIISDTSKCIYRTGGIVGFQSAGSISECYNTADISAWNYRNGNQGTGGILGSMEGGTVSYCYNTADVHNGTGASSDGGKQGAGGIVGAISAGDVSNCYSTGSAFGPGSAGVIIGKLGKGAYDHLFSLDTARSWQQYGEQTDEATGLKYNDGANENEDGSLKCGGAALANKYDSSYTITNSFTRTAEAMTATAFVVELNGSGSGFNVDSGNLNGGYPVLAWQGGAPIASVEVAAVYDQISAIPDDVTTEADIAAVDEAVAAYNALSDDQKALVPASSITVLLKAQKSVAAVLVEQANAKADAAEQERASAAAAATEAKAQVAQLTKDLATAKAAQGLKANTMTVKTKVVKAKAKKKTTIKKAKAFTVKNAKGKITFAKISGNAKITVSKAGKVVVKKGLKKGKTYKVKVLVCAAGDSSYAPAMKTVTLKVKVQ